MMLWERLKYLIECLFGRDKIDEDDVLNVFAARRQFPKAFMVMPKEWCLSEAIFYLQDNEEQTLVCQLGDNNDYGLFIWDPECLEWIEDLEP